MAKQVAKSGLAGKLGTTGRRAHDEHKGDETKLSGGGDLPAGIEAGIARLVLCKFDQYKTGENQGEYYFMAQGVVVEPKDYEGLRTSIGPEPLCDTPKRSRPDVDAHIGWVLNEMRKLGVDTESIEFDDLEDTAAALVEESPYFRFRTWSGDKQEIEKRKDGKFYVGNKAYRTEEDAKAANPFAGQEPRVNHDWRGFIEGYEPDVEDEVEDESEEQEESSTVGARKKVAKKAPVKKSPPVKKKAAPEPEPEEEEEEVELTDDLNALAELADGGDEDAQIRLQELAEEAGIDHASLATWAEVVEALQSEGDRSQLRLMPEDEEGEEEQEEEETEEEEEESEAPVEPSKGDVVYYKPPKGRRFIECNIVAVVKSKKTVNLVNLDDNKTKYLNVPWSSLSFDAEGTDLPF